MLTILRLEIKESLEPFSKNVPMYIKQFLMFCLTFPENALNFVTQKLQKTENFPFQILRTFDLKAVSKPFAKKLPMANLITAN